ncbi:MAG: DUF4382 domain-containing protein [bacterium JZ-2024 1]
MKNGRGLFFTVVLLWLIGCGSGGGVSILPPPGPNPQGNVEFYATDQPPNVDHFWVEIQRVELHNAQGEWKVALDFGNNPLDLDLTQLSTYRQYLGRASLPDGTYDRIRLTFGDKNSVTQWGISHSVQLDRFLEKPIFLLLGAGSAEITIDLDAQRGLIEGSDGNFLFSSDAMGIVVQPGQPGNLPPDPERPERRPVVLTGEVTQVLPEDQSFRLRLTRAAHGEEVWIFTSDLTRYFPEGKSFADIQEGILLDVVGLPEVKGERKGFLALDIFFLETHPGEQVSGVILEIFYDLRLIRLGLPDHWRGRDCGDPRLQGAPGIPPLSCPPLHFIWVSVDDNAVIEKEDGTPIQWTDLHPGMFITAFGRWRAFDLFQAHRIVVKGEIPPPPAKIVGKLVEKNCELGILIVATPGDPPSHSEHERWKIVLTEETKIEDEHGNPISCADLHEGDILKILGIRGEEEHTLIAHFIKRLPPPPPPPPMELIGKLAEKDCEHGILILLTPGRENSEERWKVLLTDQTKIVDEKDNPISCSDLQQGDILLVVGHPKEGEEHTIVAFLVKRLPAPPPPPLELIGKLAEKDCEHGILILLTPGRENSEERWKVLLTDQTKIVDEKDNPISCSDLQQGDILLVVGHPKEGEEHTIVAFLVKRLPAPPPPPSSENTVVFGAIKELNGERCTFLVKPPAPPHSEMEPPPIPVRTNEETKIYDREGHQKSCSDLREGMFVAVVGTPLREERAFLAKTIYIIRLELSPVHTAGIIMRKGEDREILVLATPDGERTVKVLADTLILDSHGEKLSYEQLRIEDFVLVFGREDGAEGGVILAEFILRQSHRPL